MTRPCSMLLLCLSLVGCDGEAPELDAGVDAAAPVDAGSDAATDAGSDAGPGPSPGEVIAENVCDSAGSIALAADGSRAAFVSCGGDVAVWIVRLPAGAPTRVGDAAIDTQVLFSPDSAWLAWGDSGGWSIQGVSMTVAAVQVAAGVIDELRFVTVDPTGTPTLRLLTLATDGATRRVTMRSDSDLFLGSVTLVEDADLTGSLTLVSGSRNSLIIETDDGATRSYDLLATDGSGAPSTLPIDPDTLVLGPVGMGDTHGIAHRGMGLSFVEFATGTEVVLETDGVPAASPLFAIEDAVDGRYAYYLRNGDPTRRLRNGSATSQVLGDAEATDLWVTPNESTLLYRSGGRVFSVAVDGTDTTDLGPYSPFTFDGAILRTSAELALIDRGAIVRFVPGATGGESVIDTRGVVAGSAGYDALGARLLWQRESDDSGRVDVLRVLGVGLDTPTTIAWDVEAWWAVPTRSQLLFRSTSGALLRR